MSGQTTGQGSSTPPARLRRGSARAQTARSARVVRTVTIQEVLSLVGRKWTVSVLQALEDEPRRFFQIRAGVGGVQPKVLRETLRALEKDGIVERVLHDDGTGSKGIGYELTDLGASVTALLETVHEWGCDHLGEIHSAQRSSTRIRRAS